MIEEKYVDVISSHDEWVSIINDNIDRYNADMAKYGINHKDAIFLKCFESIDTFLIAPVGVIDHVMISAKSVKCHNEQEVTDFIEKNDNIVPYMLFKQGNYYIFRYGEIR